MKNYAISALMSSGVFSFILDVFLFSTGFKRKKGEDNVPWNGMGCNIAISCSLCV